MAGKRRKIFKERPSAEEAQDGAHGAGEASHYWELARLKTTIACGSKQD